VNGFSGRGRFWGLRAWEAERARRWGEAVGAGHLADQRSREYIRRLPWIRRRAGWRGRAGTAEGSGGEFALEVPDGVFAEVVKRGEALIASSLEHEGSDMRL